MPANVYMKSINLGSPDWEALADEPLVMNATVIASSKNTGNIDVRFREGALAKWPPGAAAMLEGVDLSEIEVKGSSGHWVLVVGYTR
ncbi:MAG: hypothetical protein HRF50_17540 [Phycisphaerae bacterium]|jgi:hypothetical protein